MTGSQTPSAPPELIFGNHEDGTRQLHTAYCPAHSQLDQYCVILAGLQAVRPRCAAGAAPGPRLRVPHTQNTPETARKRSQLRLDRFRPFRDDPRDWRCCRMKFPAQVSHGCRVRHRPARGAQLLYFSAVHVKTISSDQG
jgi:hypothetical protein